MNENELSVLAWGIGLLFAYGLFHMFGLELIRWAKPRQDRHRHLGLLFTFWGLAVLHLVEIAIGAGLLYYLLSAPDYGSLSDGFGSTAVDYLYFAGASFSTLGYTNLEAHGAIRLLVMMLSLSGFMLITWSATFIYTIWGESFRKTD
ncbi:ion channel [Alteripontixanthobacter muriae]|uniref:ion channel n=1 Tax=Alteripontixanthobacter muriae TaxID=2705546 RepID=UPI0019D57C0D|nr:ion channel [Alteripontixanthobacter muriae]